MKAALFPLALNALLDIALPLSRAFRPDDAIVN
jgi:hypothetical protein